jgi:serine/threonine protein kinase
MISDKSIVASTMGIAHGMDCKSLLQNKGVEFLETNNHFFVGTILPKKGWILHLSIIESQFDDLISTVIPFLLETQVPFSVLKNERLAKLCLDGSFGFGQVGKIIAVYPVNDIEAVSLAAKLISLTAELKGPAISTDILLKGIVYTLYSDYDANGDYSSSIPAKTKDVEWPYKEITPPIVPVQKKLWNYKYKPLSLIKDDLKGRVIMANYFKSLFTIKLCVIKEGIQNVWSDKWGRDIIDRLKWQHELYAELAGKVNIPNIFDFFYENENAYLVMEFIKGDSLDGKISSIYNGNSWQSLAVKDKLVLIEYLLNVITVMKQLHKLGYIHRDITPANFLIDKRDVLFLIDMELTYSLKHHKPNPPFRLGTPGYASPEQLEHQLPTVKEDIYALGALMLFMFTGISPVKFEKKNRRKLLDSLCFFSENYPLSALITSCLLDNSEERPCLDKIRDAINTFKQELSSSRQQKSGKTIHSKLYKTDWNLLINEALKGLVTFGHLNRKNQWESLIKQDDIVHGYQPVERIVQAGFQTGVAGILYLLSRAQKMGYTIEPCRKAFEASSEFIRQAISNTEVDISPGVYDGLAGIGLVLHEGISAGLLAKDSYCQFLDQCYMAECSGLDLANGIAGQGISLLQSRNMVSASCWQPLLEKVVQRILSEQQKDGSWNVFRSKGKHGDKVFGLAHGIAGLLYFLIEYDNVLKNVDVSNATKKGLSWLIRNFHKKGMDHVWNTTTKSKSIDKWGCNTGIPGIALIFIKAYESYNNPLYKKIAEDALYALPGQPIYNDFTYAYGLSGLGEVYLEADRVFKRSEWQARADWISNLFWYTFQRNTNGAGFWSVTTHPDPEPDLLTGSSGIIHFLMRYHNKDRLPFILNRIT